jgi:hypothetical protein
MSRLHIRLVKSGDVECDIFWDLPQYITVLVYNSKIMIPVHSRLYFTNYPGRVFHVHRGKWYQDHLPLGTVTWVRDQYKRLNDFLRS